MKQIKHLGVWGNGETLREAKADAERQVKEIMDADYQPIFLSWRGNAVIITRSPFGIESRNIYGDQMSTGLCMHGKDSMESVCNQARLHLAQLGCDLSENEAPAILNGSLDLFGQYFSWLAWQRAYRAAPDSIPNGTLRHQWACEHACEFQLRQAA